MEVTTTQHKATISRSFGYIYVERNDVLEFIILRDARTQLAVISRWDGKQFSTMEMEQPVMFYDMTDRIIKDILL